MQLFYSPELNLTDKEFTFNPDESKHIIRVLRKKAGDILNITNGKGYLFSSEIEQATPKKCEVRILSVDKKEPLRNYRLHIAISPTQHLNRFEWFLEKATEIGVDEITPLICEHSNHKKLKLERCKTIVQAAAKQSLQYYFPVVNEPIDFSSFLDQTVNYEQCLIAHCKDVERVSLKTVISKNTDTIILIGPEGDFSEKEISESVQKNYSPVSLGSSRLRTETAGIVAVDTVSVMNQ
jgi:16S rRNA (uracil1498-N3)-methyltransferase